MKSERDTFSRLLKEELSRVRIRGPEPAYWELKALSCLVGKEHAKPYLRRRLFYLNKELRSSSFRATPDNSPDFQKLSLSPDNRRGFLRGIFLARGSVSSPNRGHHLEIPLPSEQTAKGVSSLITGEGLKNKIIMRRSSWVVYVKGADQISEFLALLGGTRAVLQYEGVRVQKALKSSVLRQVNMDRANVSRSVESSLRQLEDIKLIDFDIGLHRLPPALSQAARARMAHQALTMEELGQVLDPPISKSAVNHRFRRIARIAAKLRDNSGPGKL